MVYRLQRCHGYHERQHRNLHCHPILRCGTQVSAVVHFRQRGGKRHPDGEPKLLDDRVCSSFEVQRTQPSLFLPQAASHSVPLNLLRTLCVGSGARNGARLAPGPCPGTDLFGMGPRALRAGLRLVRSAVPLGRGAPLPAPLRAGRRLLPSIPAGREDRRLALGRRRDGGRPRAAQGQLQVPARCRSLHHGHLPHRPPQGRGEVQRRLPHQASHPRNLRRYAGVHAYRSALPDPTRPAPCRPALLSPTAKSAASGGVTAVETPIPNLRVLDRSAVAKELDIASELFHRINLIIPPNQELLSVPPTCRVRDAVALMRKHGYSQVPVVQSGEVLGVFSYRSFAKEAASATLEELDKQRCAPGDLHVDEFLEQFEFARVTEEMNRVFDAMDRDNGVLVGTPDRLIGILTPMDFLRYLYQVASPFVLVSEIELALRALIRVALSEEQIELAATRSLVSAY